MPPGGVVPDRAACENGAWQEGEVIGLYDPRVVCARQQQIPITVRVLKVWGNHFEKNCIRKIKLIYEREASGTVKALCVHVI